MEEDRAEAHHGIFRRNGAVEFTVACDPNANIVSLKATSLPIHEVAIPSKAPTTHYDLEVEEERLGRRLEREVKVLTAA